MGKEETIAPEVRAKVEEYAYKHYKMFKKKTLLISEGDNCFFVKTNKDGSPLVLGKSILK
jgi:hypothetical protein